MDIKYVFSNTEVFPAVLTNMSTMIDLIETKADEVIVHLKVVDEDIEPDYTHPFVD